MNIEAERIFGKHAAIRVPDSDFRHLRYPHDQQALINERLTRHLPAHCGTCPKLEKATSRSYHDMSIHALARCSLEQSGGGQCPDGTPVGSYRIQVVFHDDINAEESHIKVFDNQSLKNMDPKSLNQVIEAMKLVAGPTMGDIRNFEREYLTTFDAADNLRRQPTPDEIMPLKSDPINRDVPQTTGVEAW